MQLHEARLLDTLSQLTTLSTIVVGLKRAQPQLESASEHVGRGAARLITTQHDAELLHVLSSQRRRIRHGPAAEGRSEH